VAAQDEEETVVRFSRAQKDSNNTDQLDRAGQTILQQIEERFLRQDRNAQRAQRR
jgi:hypothetical protein